MFVPSGRCIWIRIVSNLKGRSSTNSSTTQLTLQHTSISSHLQTYFINNYTFLKKHGMHLFPSGIIDPYTINSNNASSNIHWKSAIFSRVPYSSGNSNNDHKCREAGTNWTKWRDDQSCYIIWMHSTLLDAPPRSYISKSKHKPIDLKCAKFASKKVQTRAIIKLHPVLTLHWDLAKLWPSQLQWKQDNIHHAMYWECNWLCSMPHHHHHILSKKHELMDLQLCRLVNKNVQRMAITKLHLCIPPSCIEEKLLTSTTSAAVNIANYVENLNQIEIFESVIA